MLIKTNHILYILLGLISSRIMSQESSRMKNDTITTETTYIVKPYSPKISDAFKVKEIPSISEDLALKRKSIKYNIFSIPVASTFVPAKTLASSIEKSAPLRLFDNYVSAGVGSYTSFLAELYLNHSINNNETIGSSLSHQSSEGGIDGSIVDNNFLDTNFKGYYLKKQSDYTLEIEFDAAYEMFNWYGVPENQFEDTVLQSLEPKQYFIDFDLGVHIDFENKALNSGSILFSRLIDAFESHENRLQLNSNINFQLQRGVVNTTFKLDYLDGEFQRSLFNDEPINYSNFQFGVIPNYEIKKSNLILNLGVSAYYMNDLKFGKNKFYIFPKITMQYSIVDDVLLTYGGIEGDLIQNTFDVFRQQNPFMSPTLSIVPTDQQYDVYVGLKGRLAQALSYHIKGVYKAENNSPLIKSNVVQLGETKSYQYGNSFGVVYDDLKMFSLFGELNMGVSDKFNLGMTAEYITYAIDTESEAWNRPNFEASLLMNLQFNDRWYAGANLFYTGKRKDEIYIIDPLVMTTTRTIALQSYLDANMYVGFHVNDLWSVFMKANNITNQNYDRWMNYQVQGFQVLAGTTFKFDF